MTSRGARDSAWRVASAHRDSAIRAHRAHVSRRHRQRFLRVGCQIGARVLVETRNEGVNRILDATFDACRDLRGPRGPGYPPRSAQAQGLD